jgi:VCBS repeat-containing protein
MLSVIRPMVCLSAIVLLALPASAGAAPADAEGGLLQLAPPNDCVSDMATVSCGTHVGGGLGTAHDVAVSPDGKNAYVASEKGALSTFTRNATTGALTFVTCVKDQGSTEACPANSPNAGDLAGAHAVDISADGNFVYVAASAGSTNSITVFSRNNATGALAPLTTSNGGFTDECISDAGTTGCRQAIGLKGVSNLTVTPSSVYAVSQSNSTLVRLPRDAATGRLTSGTATADCFRGTASTDTACGSGPTPAGQTNGLNGASAVAVTPDGKNLYAASRDSSAVVLFTRNTTTGVLTAPSCTVHGSTSTDCTAGSPTGGLNGALGIVATDGNVYVAAGPGTVALTGNTLATFTRNGSTGALTESQCYRDAASSGEAGACNTGTPPGLAGADALAITSDGKFLYVSASVGNDVAEFSRNTGNGDVTPLPGSDSCVGEAGSPCPVDNRGAKGITGTSSIVAASDFVYVTGPTDDAAAAFSVQRAPTCSNTSDTTPHDQAKIGDLSPLCTDPNDRDALTFAKVTDPTNGTVTVDPDGTYTYTPNTGFSGMDSFTYRANDGHANSNTATVTITVAQAPPVATVTDASTNEGDTGQHNMSFDVSLSGARTTTITVDYATTNGTATADEDFTPTSGTLTFDPGQTTKSVDVPVNGDTTFEADETLELTLSSPSNAVLPAGGAVATGTINNDDAPTPVVSVADASTTEGNTGQHPMSFAVSLSGVSSGTVTVDYATSNGTATAGSDYVPASGTLTFAPGETSKSVSVPVKGEKAFEADETVLLTLTNPTNATLATGEAQSSGTIVNDDALPKLAIKLTNFPSEITLQRLVNKGIKFQEVANRGVRFDNTLFGSRRGLGFGTSTKFNVELASQEFPFGRATRRVTLKPDEDDIGFNSSFRLRVRIVATDRFGKRAVRKKGVTVTG